MSGGARKRVAVDCPGRGDKCASGVRSLIGFLIASFVSFAVQANNQTSDDVFGDSPSAVVREEGLERDAREVVPVALIEQLRDKWRAEAMAGTSDAEISEDHRALLVDALSRVNWTPFCSYTEESVMPDEEEARIRHHVFEFNQDTLELLIEEAADSNSGFFGDTNEGEAGGFDTSLDEFAGMREDLAAVKIIDASDLTVTYELPVPAPSELVENDTSPEDIEDVDGFEIRFMRKLLENLRLLLTVDAQNRGPKEMRVELKKSVRVIPGVKIKKMNFATNFRYLEDVGEFAVDRNASEMRARAFLVAGFSERESMTLSDFRCVPKG